jgi:hypothetical protein
MGRELRGKRARHVVHAALDDAHAHVLHGGGKQPGEIGAERIVWSKRAMQGARGKEVAHLRRLKGLVHPGPGALELEAVLVDGVLARELLGQRRRRRGHAGNDIGLRREVALIEPAPRFGVGARELRHAARRLLRVTADDEGAAVGKDLRPVGVGRDQLEPVAGEPELLRRGCELGDEIAARVNVGEEAGRGELL